MIKFILDGKNMEETTNLLKPILNTIQITSAVILIGVRFKVRTS